MPELTRDQINCNKILSLMKLAGYTDVADDCSGWSLDDIDYFLANYQEHYLNIPYAP